MRRRILITAVTTVLLALGGTTAQATAPVNVRPPGDLRTGSHDGWVPVPVPPVDRAAGVVCDFAVHGDPVVADLWMRILRKNPDGTTRSEAWTGPLVYRFTNQSTGTQVEADASGDGIRVFHADGSYTWFIHGGLVIAIPAGGGNRPRGLYAVDGTFTVTVTADHYQTLRLQHGTVRSLCPLLA